MKEVKKMKIQFVNHCLLPSFTVMKNMKLAHGNACDVNSNGNFALHDLKIVHRRFIRGMLFAISICYTVAKYAHDPANCKQIFLLGSTRYEKAAARKKRRRVWNFDYERKFVSYNP